MDFFTKTEKDILFSADKIIVGFSGGADSTLLLHKTFNFLTESNSENKLLALHINHQSQSESHAWEEHCQKFCQDREIHLQTEKVEVTAKGEGFEAAARSARLALFNSFGKNTVIILGHHLDDQIETILFRIFRGTGMKGLSGIKRQSTLGSKVVLRPLFDLTKKEIIELLDKERLNYITDQSNHDNSFSRNYLRNTVIPKIYEKWPGAKKNISRMANIIRKQNILYESYLETVLERVADEDGLKLDELKNLDYFERAELIRIWLDKQSFSTPNESQMKEIEKSFFQSRQESNPVIKFQREDAQRLGVILTKTNNYLIAEEINE
tara:strand:- start:1235 stop:2206 length:972 start_codon:yes stop_codon:yes gene_type:complete